MTQITERALIQRINRKLAHEGEQLCIPRGDRWWSDLGGAYIVNVRSNSILAGHVDIERLGRELAVLRPLEEVR